MVRVVTLAAVAVALGAAGLIAPSVAGGESVNMAIVAGAYK